jgi:hypothetical protein
MFPRLLKWRRCHHIGWLLFLPSFCRAMNLSLHDMSALLYLGPRVTFAVMSLRTEPAGPAGAVTGMLLEHVYAWYKWRHMLSCVASCIINTTSDRSKISQLWLSSTYNNGEITWVMDPILSLLTLNDGARSLEHNRSPTIMPLLSPVALYLTTIIFLPRSISDVSIRNLRQSDFEIFLDPLTHVAFWQLLWNDSCYARIYPLFLLRSDSDRHTLKRSHDCLSVSLQLRMFKSLFHTKSCFKRSPPWSMISYFDSATPLFLFYSIQNESMMYMM